MKKTKKGFTLVELLVVIAIIAILAAIIAPNAFKAIEKSKVATAEADYKAIKTAALGYYTDTGAWAANSASEAEFVTGTGMVSTWNGPYLEKWKSKNPWGGNYTYIKADTAAAMPGFVTGKTYYALRLEGVPASAITRLEADLDGGTLDSTTKTTGTVRQDATTATTVYIIISEQ